MVKTSTRVEGHVFTHNVGWVPEHLKHPLKTVDQYWSPVSDHGQTARVCGDIIAPYISKLCGTNDVSFVSFSLILMFWLWMEWWMALYRRGPPIWWMAIRLTARCSFLGLRACSAEQWSSARHFQINYPRSSSITVCVAAWNQLSRDGGGIMSTRVRIASR